MLIRNHILAADVNRVTCDIHQGLDDHSHYNLQKMTAQAWPSKDKKLFHLTCRSCWHTTQIPEVSDTFPRFQVNLGFTTMSADSDTSLGSWDIQCIAPFWACILSCIEGAHLFCINKTSSAYVSLHPSLNFFSEETKISSLWNHWPKSNDMFCQDKQGHSRRPLVKEQVTLFFSDTESLPESLLIWKTDFLVLLSNVDCHFANLRKWISPLPSHDSDQSICFLYCYFQVHGDWHVKILCSLGIFSLSASSCFY